MATAGSLCATAPGVSTHRDRAALVKGCQTRNWPALRTARTESMNQTYAGLLEEEKAERRRLQLQLNAARAQIHDLRLAQLRSQSAEAEALALKAELVAAERAQAELRGALGRAVVESQRLKQALTAADSQLTEISATFQRSTSWRLTAPLRWMSRLLNPLRRD